MESTSTVYVNGRMYGNGVDERFDTELNECINKDGVINATNEHRQRNRKSAEMKHTSNPEVKSCKSSTTKGARSSLVL